MVDKERLGEDLKSALKAGDKNRLNTIRMVLTAIKLAEVEKMDALDETAVLAIFQKQAKMRREAIEDAGKADRQDLVPALEEELSILKEYLPEPLSEDKLEEMVAAAIIEAAAQGPQDMGNVMKVIMSQVGGRADGKVVSQLVRAMLTKAADTDE
jgi:uncharacterized protein YqeY